MQVEGFSVKIYKALDSPCQRTLFFCYFLCRDKVRRVTKMDTPQ